MESELNLLSTYDQLEQRSNKGFPWWYPQLQQKGRVHKKSSTRNLELINNFTLIWGQIEVSLSGSWRFLNGLYRRTLVFDHTRMTCTYVALKFDYLQWGLACISSLWVSSIWVSSDSEVNSTYTIYCHMVSSIGKLVHFILFYYRRSSCIVLHAPGFI